MIRVALLVLKWALQKIVINVRSKGYYKVVTNNNCVTSINCAAVGWKIFEGFCYEACPAGTFESQRIFY